MIYNLPHRPYTVISDYEVRANASHRATRADLYGGAKPEAYRADTLLDRAVDALAEFVENCVAMPGSALVLLAIGQWSIIIPAVLWAVLS